MSLTFIFHIINTLSKGENQEEKELLLLLHLIIFFIPASDVIGFLFFYDGTKTDEGLSIIHSLSPYSVHICIIVYYTIQIEVIEPYEPCFFILSKQQKSASITFNPTADPLKSILIF